MEFNGKSFEAIIATPGCGKTFLCEKYPNKFVDVDEERLKLKYVIPKNITREELEKTKGERTFKKRKRTGSVTQKLYAILDREIKKGKVLIAAPHPESFEYFVNRNIPFCFVYPAEGMREEIKQRFISRNNDEKFIKENDELFDTFRKSNVNEKRTDIHYEFKSGEYLETILKKFGYKF